MAFMVQTQQVKSVCGSKVWVTMRSVYRDREKAIKEADRVNSHWSTPTRVCEYGRAGDEGVSIAEWR